jgi:superfamily II DNA or RNA helicase
MPRIFDNIEQSILGALQETLKVSTSADFCVGYFNLRGWRYIDELMEKWQGGEQACCRLMIGMQEKPEDELHKIFSLRDDHEIDQRTVIHLKKRVAQDFREQLLIGAPTNKDQEGLRRLSAQLRAKRLVVKLFLRYKLHAKLYLLYNPTHPYAKAVGYLGSSNLTLSGLAHQGELNVDVVDNDACHKLEQWFNDRWEDRWCLDISEELVDIIDESWAREEIIPPYRIYLKMAYHLSEEARFGLTDFRIPAIFHEQLFEYQAAAVKIAAHHLNKRGGVIIGDVVGLGKTLMATTLARIMQDDYNLETLIICPKNLVKMWDTYMQDYGIIGRVCSLSNVINELPGLRRYRLVIVDESHNLRNREGKRYRAIKEYIEKNESKCILLTATPYNKTYLDISTQLRLFLSDEMSKDLGIRPEHLLNEIGEANFNAQHQCPVRSLTAFEKSEHADDWRELMRHFLVRRTRSFIQENYAQHDSVNGRTYLEFPDHTRSYFPVRIPRTVPFSLGEDQQTDPYARLYSAHVVDTISELNLPRYGLASYMQKRSKATGGEAQILQSLSRGGKRLMGFCRTNLFKRLESGGPAFLQSIERHALRNYIFLCAIEQNLELPIGTQNAELLDSRTNDEDEEAVLPDTPDEDDASTEGMIIIEDFTTPEAVELQTEQAFKRKAAIIYQHYVQHYRRRFKWIKPEHFTATLKKDLQQDCRKLLAILAMCRSWKTEQDTKFNALLDLLTQKHPQEKVLIFTQFADTVRYLTSQLKAHGMTDVEGVTGDMQDPTQYAWRFSPVSNNRRAQVEQRAELRILIATDVLSEGQNLQDAAIVVNYDLPWAIIRLIQRAGRIDRIGQRSETLYCYSFLPAEGIEKLIGLRGRVRKRLQENAEVVGTDERFFEDDRDNQAMINLYNEKAGILDGEADTEIDLASQAYQIWKNATDADPTLKTLIERMPNMVFSTRAHQGTALAPEGVLVYMRTRGGNDSLAWINRKGESVTQSHLAILHAAACNALTPAVPLPEEQHPLVEQGVKHIIYEEMRGAVGQLGSRSGARMRTYNRLMHFAETTENTLFPPSPELKKAIDEIYRYPLQEAARDTLNRQLRADISDDDLANLVIQLREANRLCHIQEEVEELQDPQIICSLGLFPPPA